MAKPIHLVLPSSVHRRARCRFAALSLLVVALAAQAVGNFGFMRDAPLEFFNEADKQLFNEAVQQTLDTARDGESRTWSNVNTGSSGEVTALATLQLPQGQCRRLHFANRAGGRNGEATAVFCPNSQGRWVVAP